MSKLNRRYFIDLNLQKESAFFHLVSFKKFRSRCKQNDNSSFLQESISIYVQLGITYYRKQDTGAGYWNVSKIFQQKM